MVNHCNILLVYLTIFSQVTKVLGLGTNEWGGGHIDTATAEAFGGTLHDLGNQAGLCGCTRAGRAFIESKWRTTGYNDDDVFVLLIPDNLVSDETASCSCKVYQFTSAEASATVGGVKLDDELPPHIHQNPPYRLFLTYDNDGSGRAIVGQSRRRLESIVEKRPKGMDKSARRQLVEIRNVDVSECTGPTSYMEATSPVEVHQCQRSLPANPIYKYEGNAIDLFQNSNSDRPNFDNCVSVTDSSGDHVIQDTTVFNLFWNTDNSGNRDNTYRIEWVGSAHPHIDYYFRCENLDAYDFKVNKLDFYVTDSTSYTGTDTGSLSQPLPSTLQTVQYFALDPLLTPYFDFTDFYKNITISTAGTSPFAGCGYEFSIFSAAQFIDGATITIWWQQPLLDDLNNGDNSTANLFVLDSIKNAPYTYNFYIHAQTTGGHSSSSAPSVIGTPILTLETYVNCSSLTTTLVDGSNPVHIQSIQVNMSQPTNIFMNETAFTFANRHPTAAPYNQSDLGFPFFWFQTSDFPCTTTIPSLWGGLNFLISDQDSVTAAFAHPTLTLRSIQADVSGHSDLYYVQLNDSSASALNDNTAILGNHTFWIIAQDGNKPYPNNLTVPCEFRIFCRSYMVLTGNKTLQTCARRLPNDIVTFSVLKMFQNSDGSAKNFGNCVELSGTYPQGISIPAQSNLSLQTNIELTNLTYNNIQSFDYTFQCENLDCPGNFVNETAKITIYDPTTVLNGLVTIDKEGKGKPIPANLTQYSELTPKNWTGHVWPSINFIEFWDSVQQPGSECGWSFSIGTSQTDYSWPVNFDNDFDLEINPLNYAEEYGRNFAKVNMDASLLTVPGEYQFIILATSDTAETRPPTLVRYQLLESTAIALPDMDKLYVKNLTEQQQACDNEPLCQSLEAGWLDYSDKNYVDLYVRTQLIYPQQNVHQLITFIQCIPEGTNSQMPSTKRRIFEGDFPHDQKVDAGTSTTYFEFSRFRCVTPFTHPFHNETYEFSYQVILKDEYDDYEEFECPGNPKCIAEPDDNGKLYFHPNDPNTVSFIQFFILVGDQRKPKPNQELFPNQELLGLYSLNITCDNNIISPILNISGQVNVTKIQLYQGSFTTKQDEQELLFNNFSVSLERCEIVSYNLSVALSNQDRFIEYTDIPNPLFGEEGFNMTVNTMKIRDYIFSVRAQDKWGNEAFSKPFQVSIIPVPSDVVDLDWKPILLSEPIDYQLILDRTEQVSFFELQVPEVYDHDNNYDTAILSSDTIDERFFTYDKESNKIQITIPCQFYELVLGTHIINIILTDESRGRKKYEQQVSFTVSRESVDCGLEEIIEEEPFTVPDQERLTADIDDIDPYGIVTVEFNAIMQTEHINLTKINSTIMDLYIEPSENWHKFENFSMNQTSNLTTPSLNFTWEVIEYSQNKMVFNLTFIDPLQVSPKVLRDKLVIHVKEISDIFYSKDFRTLHFDNRTLKGEVPKQMNTTIAETAKIVNDALKVTMITSALMSPIAFGPLLLMVTMINHLQLVIHLPMIEVVVPANTLMVQGYLIEIATFDIIPEEKTDAFVKWALKKFLSIEIEDKEDEEFVGDIPGQVQDLGFDSHYLQRNVSTILTLLGLWAFKVFVHWIMPLFIFFLKKCHKQEIKEEPDSQDEEKEGGSPDTEDKAKEKEEPYIVQAHKSCLKGRRTIGKKLFFTEIIWLLLEPYLDLLIILFMQIKSKQNIFRHQTYSVGVFAFVIIPVTLVWVSTRPKKMLEEPDFKQKWGSLYSQFKLHQTPQVMYYLIFVIKRLFFVLICYTDYLREHNSIMLVILALFFHLIAQYHGRYMPHKDPQGNKIDLVNEYFFAIHIYMIMCYTEFVIEQATIFMIGWIHCIVIALQILYNFYFVVKELNKNKQENEDEALLQKKCEELMEQHRMEAEKRTKDIRRTLQEEARAKPWFEKIDQTKIAVRMEKAIGQQDAIRKQKKKTQKKDKNPKRWADLQRRNLSDQETQKQSKKDRKSKSSQKDPVIKSSSNQSLDSDVKPKVKKKSKKAQLKVKIQPSQPTKDYILEVENYNMSARTNEVRQDNETVQYKPYIKEPEPNLMPKIDHSASSKKKQEEASTNEDMGQHEINSQAQEGKNETIKEQDPQPYYIFPKREEPERLKDEDFKMSLDQTKQVLRQLGLDYDELYGDKAQAQTGSGSEQIPSKKDKKPVKKKKKAKS